MIKKSIEDVVKVIKKFKREMLNVDITNLEEIKDWKREDAKESRRLEISLTPAETLVTNEVIGEVLYIEYVMKEMQRKTALDTLVKIYKADFDLLGDMYKLRLDVTILKEYMENKEGDELVHVDGKNMVWNEGLQWGM